mmetsp:Transcript_28123/g.87021  ORF Transcript_28123/g.87021 Transcript_28123/m.87021 type:complete len:221 (-) Transcript_28123:125-787(-)
MATTLVQVPPGGKPGDTMEVDVGSPPTKLHVKIPEGLKEGDTFQVASPVVPIAGQVVSARAGDVVDHNVTDEEKLCLDLRFSVRIIACVDVVLCLLNIIFASWWALVGLIGAVCGFLGAQLYNPCLTITYCVFTWIWLFAIVLNIIIVSAWWSADHSEYRHWNAAWYTFFIIFSIIMLCIRSWICYMVSKFLMLLSSVGEIRARDIDEAGAYNQKCVVVA